MDMNGRERAKSTDLNMFVSEQNVARYRGLLDPETDARKRRTILRLLDRGSAKLRGRSATAAE